MKPLAESLGCTRTHLALAWTAAQPAVSSVILGATSIAQLAENLGALDVKLTPEICADLEEIFPPSLG
jgi:aryl-alcohol dehydrogenase-like predicted oxidoreductase